MLKEQLLIAPILVSYEYIQQLLIPANNFDTFLNISVLRVILVALVWLLTDPAEYYLEKIRSWFVKFLEKKSQFNEKYFFLIEKFEKKKKNHKSEKFIL